MELSNETIELINKQAKDYLIGWANGDEASAYRTGAQAWAVWKQKAEAYEKALKDANNVLLSGSGIFPGSEGSTRIKEALEQFK